MHAWAKNIPTPINRGRVFRQNLFVLLEILTKDTNLDLFKRKRVL